MSDSESTEDRLQHAIDALVSVSLDLGTQAKVMSLTDVHIPQAIPDSAKLEMALKPYKDKVLGLFDQELAKRVEEAKLHEWITAPLQPHSHHANGTRMCVPVNYRNARIRELRGQTLNTQTKENE